MRTSLVVTTLPLSLLVTACFSPDYGQGGFACTKNECPSGYTCVSELVSGKEAKVCRPNGTKVADARVDQKVGQKDGSPDRAPGKDAGRDAVREGLPVDLKADSLVVVDCAKSPDGTDCSMGTSRGLICMNKICTVSFCGDKYVDKLMGEECDDGNTEPTDGCNSCKYGCKANSDCDDKLECNGVEKCNITAHKCLAGTPLLDGKACTLPGGGDGVCNGGVCAAKGCGNTIREDPEECDDGNKIDGDGCNNDCKFSCHQDSDCSDGNACTGIETCKIEVGKQTCLPGTAVNCDDAKGCTIDTCEPATGTCTNKGVDADGDGHVAAPCGDDCNDTNPNIYGGAHHECVDTLDNDCDGSVDETPATSGSCWKDPDGDTYADTAATKISSCACPSGYTSRDPSVSGQADCAPHVKDANPGQTKWFTVGYIACVSCLESFDWNCDGTATQHYTTTAGATCLKLSKGTLFACTGSGWVTTVPACGASAKYKTCSADTAGGTCVATYGTRTQECR